MKPRPGALYPILNVTSEEEIEAALLMADRFAAFQISMLQLRCKGLSTDTMVAVARDLVDRGRDSGFVVIVNDRCDVAISSKAAGVHLGQQDLHPADARKLMGPDAVIGYSTHAAEEAGNAPNEADYLGFGPVFESPTKAGVRQARGLNALRDACATTAVPIVAIGGLNLERASSAWKAGAASVAVISELANTAEPEKLLEAYQRAAGECGINS